MGFAEYAEYDDLGLADLAARGEVSPAELAKYRGKTWETCQTFSGSWGYYRDETSWKTHRQLLDLLITSAANGGNLILNVGPTARGDFDYRAKNALDTLAYWMHANHQAIAMLLQIHRIPLPRRETVCGSQKYRVLRCRHFVDIH